MWQFYCGLYGLALFLSFLGLVYAFIENIWRRYSSSNNTLGRRYPVSSSDKPETDLIRTENIEKISTFWEVTKTLDTALQSEFVQFDQIVDGTQNCTVQTITIEPVQQCQGSNITQMQSEDLEQVHTDCDNEMNNDQLNSKSWSERRRERRQRYKENQLLNNSPNETTIPTSVVTYMEDLSKNDDFIDSDDNRFDVINKNESDDVGVWVKEDDGSMKITNLDDDDDLSIDEDVLDDLVKTNATYAEDDNVVQLDDCLTTSVIEDKEVEGESTTTTTTTTTHTTITTTNTTNPIVHQIHIPEKSIIQMDPKATPPENNNETADSSVQLKRRFSLRSKKSIDNSFETEYENYFAIERKIAALEGFHYASFTLDTQTRPSSPELVNLVEDQGVTCLDADNPDRWVVKAHTNLDRIGSITRKISRPNTASNDEFIIDQDNRSSPVSESHPSAITTTATECLTNGNLKEPVKKIGRVNAVCLSRNLKGRQRGKRNPREAFREDVISFSNKQQEARMKLRYVLTELYDTEQEYSRALKILTELLESLTGNLISNEDTQAVMHFPPKIRADIDGLRYYLSKIVQFTTSVFLDRLPACSIDPKSASECFTKTFIKTDKWLDYTAFLIHVDNLTNHILNETNAELQFELKKNSANMTINTTSDSTDNQPSWNELKSISFKHFLEVLDTPLRRLNAYRGLLKDIARYISRDGTSTRQFELAMICVSHAQRRAEEYVNFWSQIQSDISVIIKNCPRRGSDPTMELNIPPALIRMTELKVNQRKDLDVDPDMTKAGRLILLPEHLMFITLSDKVSNSKPWKMNWIIKLEEMRVGNMGTDQLWMELWHIAGEDPIKSVIRLYCKDLISRNAWNEDCKRVLMDKLTCSPIDVIVSEQIVRTHENKLWELRQHYSQLVELPALVEESLIEIHFDIMEKTQQMNGQLVNSMNSSHLNDVSCVQSFVGKRKFSKSDDDASSSYYTAEEQQDEFASAKEHLQPVNLFESYSTLDGVQSPFSEDQHSMTEYQLVNEGKQSNNQIPDAESITKTLSVKAGEQIQFNASFTISGPVAYETSWSMNGAPLPADLGAEMILSDRDTRLLISNADPKRHSGTYACCCRLFEGTESVVYFSLNVVKSASSKLSDTSITNGTIKDDITLTAVDETQQTIFYPITKNFDLYIGQLLELQVKLNKSAVVKLIGTMESVSINWYLESQLLKPDPRCQTIESDDLVILKHVTTSFMPNKLYNFICQLNLPTNTLTSVAPNLTIPVRLRYPRIEELEDEFGRYQQQQKQQANKSKQNLENINSFIKIKLTKGQPFELLSSVVMKPQTSDYLVWWAKANQLIAGNKISQLRNNYRALDEYRSDKGELIVKLVKESTSIEDKGVYRCWVDCRLVASGFMQCLTVDLAVSSLDDDQKKDEMLSLEENEIKILEFDTLKAEDMNKIPPNLEVAEKMRTGEDVKDSNTLTNGDRTDRSITELQNDKTEDIKTRKVDEAALKTKEITDGELNQTEVSKKSDEKKNEKDNKKEDKSHSEIPISADAVEESTVMHDSKKTKRRKESLDKENLKEIAANATKETDKNTENITNDTQTKLEDSNEDKKHIVTTEIKAEKSNEAKGSQSEVKDDVKSKDATKKKKGKNAGINSDEKENGDKVKKDEKQELENDSMKVPSTQAGDVNTRNDSNIKIDEKQESNSDSVKRSSIQMDDAENHKKDVNKKQIDDGSDTSKVSPTKVKDNTQEKDKKAGEKAEAKSGEKQNDLTDVEVCERMSHNKINEIEQTTPKSDHQTEKQSHDLESNDQQAVATTEIDEKSKKKKKHSKEEDSKVGEKVRKKSRTEESKHKTKEQKPDATDESQTTENHSINNLQTSSLVQNESVSDLMNDAEGKKEKRRKSSASLKDTTKKKKKEKLTQAEEQNEIPPVDLIENEAIKDKANGTLETESETKGQLMNGSDTTKSDVCTKDVGAKEKSKKKKDKGKEKSRRDSQDEKQTEIDTELTKKKTRKKSKTNEPDLDADIVDTQKTRNGSITKELYESSTQPKQATKINEIRLSAVEQLDPDQQVTTVIPDSKVYLTAQIETTETLFTPEDFVILFENSVLNTDQINCPKTVIRQTGNATLVELCFSQIRPEQGGLYEIRLSPECVTRLQTLHQLDTFDPKTILSRTKFPFLKVQSSDDSTSRLVKQYAPKEVFHTQLMPSYHCHPDDTIKLAVELNEDVFVKHFEWKFNGQPIDFQTAENIVLWRTDNWIAITLPMVTQELVGTYELCIYTPYGEFSTSTKLNFGDTKKQATTFISSQTDGLKPMFTKRLQDCDVSLDEHIRFTSRLIAEPPADIIWKHNGMILKSNERIKIFNDDVNPSISIQGIKNSDRGVYTCIAKNILGQAETKATLSVQGLDSPIDTEEDGELEDTDALTLTSLTRTSALPSQVTNVTLTNMDETGLTIAWDINNDQTVTYIIELSDDNGHWWKPILSGLTDRTAFISNDKTSPLIPVQLRVVPENEYGLGPASCPALRIPIRACVPQMQSIKPEVEFESALSVHISWPPAVPALSQHELTKNTLMTPAQILGKVTYAVELKQGSQSDWIRVADQLSTCFLIHKLHPEYSSAIRILAMNRHGESTPSPMTIVQIDQRKLLPDLALDAPWITVTPTPVNMFDNIADSNKIKRVGVKLFWKSAYLPEYIDQCLDVFYRIEWRKGKLGNWVELARDITSHDDGYPLPTGMIDEFMKDLQSCSDLPTNQVFEFRIFCYNKFGESGPTKTYRLKGAQIFRNQNYKKNSDFNLNDLIEMKPQLDNLPVISLSSDKSRLKAYINTIDLREGTTVQWIPYHESGSHSRYRIQRFIPVDRQIIDRTQFMNNENWNVFAVEDALIYGEGFLLDIKPKEYEQFIRILVLQEDNDSKHWLDTYEVLRIPPKLELYPPSPNNIEVNLISSLTSEGAAVRISWTNIANTTDKLVNSECKYLDIMNEVEYRIEARSTLSDLSPWRQVAIVSGTKCEFIDLKAENGSELIYRVIPFNCFGEGQSILSKPIKLPIILSSLERCIEDLRYMILAPESVQLRWRLGDSVIDVLGFKSLRESAATKNGQQNDDDSNEIRHRITHTVERRDGYAGEWYSVMDNLRGSLNAKVVLNQFVYLNRDISVRIVTFIDGGRTNPSRPVKINLKTEYLVPDFSPYKPHVNVTAIGQLLITWEDLDVYHLFTSRALDVTVPQVLHKALTYKVEVQLDGATDWSAIASELENTTFNWTESNPLKGYHIRVLACNQFGAGFPSRTIFIDPQIVIPNLTFVRPFIEMPVDILAGHMAPDLVWQLPKVYSLDKTFTPYTFEVQIKAVDIPTDVNSDNVWRVLETGLRRNRLSLARLDPEQEFWLRVVAVTDYGRGQPSQQVCKMVDLNAKRIRHASASIGVLHEGTPSSPSFTDPSVSTTYATLYGNLELKCTFQKLQLDNEVRFNWYLNEQSLDTDVSMAQPMINQKFHNTVSTTGDSIRLRVNSLEETDFGTYTCKAMHMTGFAIKEFIVKMADAPVFLEIPTPILTIKLHSRFELPCLVDAVPAPTLTWTRDSKRVVECHRTHIGGFVRTAEMSDNSTITTNATLSVEKCIHQDSGLYTLIAENIAGRIQTSCMVHIEENPLPKNINIRWTNIEKHYFVIRRLESDQNSDVRLLIDKKTNVEYVGKFFTLDNPQNRINGARELDCLNRLYHTNIVQLVDAIVSDNVLILIIEKLISTSLLDAVLSCSNWNEAATLTIIRPVLDALIHMHNQGVVYCGIQPENIVLVNQTINDIQLTSTSYSEDLQKAIAPLISDTSCSVDHHKANIFGRTVKLVGFESAQHFTPPELIKPCLGVGYRIEFAAPEILLLLDKHSDENCAQTIEEHINSSTDMWSLGVLAYLLLAGWPPFINFDTGDLDRDRIMNDQICFDLQEFENVSDEAKDFISQLLKKDPESRLTAEKCAKHPWIQRSLILENKVDYPLNKLLKYKDYFENTPPIQLNANEHDHTTNIKSLLSILTKQYSQSEENMSTLSSRSSSIYCLHDNISCTGDAVEAVDGVSQTFTGTDLSDLLDSSIISTNKESGLIRQNTLTETMELDSSDCYPPVPASQSLTTTEDKQDDLVKQQQQQPTSGRSSIQVLVPTFASPLRDAYFSVHSREARFSCQISSFPQLPHNLPDHQSVIEEIYPAQFVTPDSTNRNASLAAAWYLGGCLLSAGPGVSLGAAHGGWLWLCLSDLRPEQDNSVVKCVVRNRSGKAKTQARLLLGDVPKPSGRPGLVEIRPTEALISWISTNTTSYEDIIYRIDIKHLNKNTQPSWHRHGFTVDCRYLITDLQPSHCYRVRVVAGNTFGWGNYSVASSDFRTPKSDTCSSPILQPADKNWMLTWRQSADIYALSDHPIALQYTVNASSNRVPISDKSLNKLNRHGGLISSLDQIKQICFPIKTIKQGKFKKHILTSTHPMLTENQDQTIVSLPARLVCKLLYNTDGNIDPKSIKRAQREALLLTALNVSCGGTFANEQINNHDNSYLFISNRRLLPIGWSLGLLTNQNNSTVASLMQWIPGGRLIDVLIGRTEYTEFTIMCWAQQLLLAARWLQNCFFGRPHGDIRPEYILVARRNSSLPDIVLTGLGHDLEDDKCENNYAAPEKRNGSSVTNASDLWSIGAILYLLMTGEHPNESIQCNLAQNTDLDSVEKTSTKKSVSGNKPDYQAYINVKKLRKFSKYAKKMVYNCLNPNPKKRGTIDFWLDSHWFDLQREQITKLSSVVIPTIQLHNYKSKYSFPDDDAADSTVDKSFDNFD